MVGRVAAARVAIGLEYAIEVPVAGARAQLSRLVEEAASTHERFEITRNRQRVAVLPGADDYDSLLETLDILGDSELRHDHLAGIEELSKGRGVDAGQLVSVMRKAGRPSKKG
jgi:prevent-host-death family protein